MTPICLSLPLALLLSPVLLLLVTRGSPLSLAKLGTAATSRDFLLVAISRLLLGLGVVLFLIGVVVPEVNAVVLLLLFVEVDALALGLVSLLLPADEASVFAVFLVATLEFVPLLRVFSIC